jgi:hypothetical protein
MHYRVVTVEGVPLSRHRENACQTCHELLAMSRPLVILTDDDYRNGVKLCGDCLSKGLSAAKEFTR